MYYLDLSKKNCFLKSEIFLSILNELNRIDGFNNLPSETQFFFISQILKYQLEYSNFQTIDDQLLKGIQLKMNQLQTQMLYQNKSLKSSEFNSTIQKFSEISVDVTFYQTSLKLILDIFLNIHMNKIITVKMTVFISGYKTVSYKFGKNPIIEKVVIDSSSQSIKDEFFLVVQI